MSPRARCPFDEFHEYDDDGYCPPLEKADIPDDHQVSQGFPENKNPNLLLV